MPGTSHPYRKGPVSPRTLRTRRDARLFRQRFAALTGLRVAAASAESLPVHFLAGRVLPPDVLANDYGRELARRTYNALCRFEPLPPGEPWTYRRLLQIRGFGLFCLLDLLAVLARHGIGTEAGPEPSS